MPTNGKPANSARVSKLTSKPKNRDRGEPCGSPPPTPPGVRVRTTAVRLVERPLSVDARLSSLRSAMGAWGPRGSAVGVSPLLSGPKARSLWFFCRFPPMSRVAYLPCHSTPCGDRSGLWRGESIWVLLPPSSFPPPTMPSADFCTAVRAPCGALSPPLGPESHTRRSSRHAVLATPVVPVPAGHGADLPR